ncbi:hypothetical protein BJ508DRAFT_306903 [Ascobolus immersus RN42]|uniref:Uncharacterized protein n=1 Tax=Ascobolus immersus RN42 TaxID=1160509 RepID=A0A3N4I4A3_ASCIM|nr:hypothetical protein BJ508DRAFT_306903 [Ascobolus immersus RN42]
MPGPTILIPNRTSSEDRFENSHSPEPEKQCSSGMPRTSLTAVGCLYRTNLKSQTDKRPSKLEGEDWRWCLTCTRLFLRQNDQQDDIPSSASSTRWIIEPRWFSNLDALGCLTDSKDRRRTVRVNDCKNASERTLLRPLDVADLSGGKTKTRQGANDDRLAHELQLVLLGMRIRCGDTPHSTRSDLESFCVFQNRK